MINEFKRMQKLAGLLTEVHIAPAGNAIKIYVSSVDDSIYKITGVNKFTSPDNILKICTSIFNGAYGDTGVELEYDAMEEEIEPAAEELAEEASKIDPTNSIPLYVSTDGRIVFHDKLADLLRNYPDIEQSDWLPQNL
jgi:hypothetical protein